MSTDPFSYIKYGVDYNQSRYTEIIIASSRKSVKKCDNTVSIEAAYASLIKRAYKACEMNMLTGPKTPLSISNSSIPNPSAYIGYQGFLNNSDIRIQNAITPVTETESQYWERVSSPLDRYWMELYAGITAFGDTAQRNTLYGFWTSFNSSLDFYQGTRVINDVSDSPVSILRSYSTDLSETYLVAQPLVVGDARTTLAGDFIAKLNDDTYKSYLVYQVLGSDKLDVEYDTTELIAFAPDGDFPTVSFSINLFISPANHEYKYGRWTIKIVEVNRDENKYRLDISSSYISADFNTNASGDFVWPKPGEDCLLTITFEQLSENTSDLVLYVNAQQVLLISEMIPPGLSKELYPYPDYAFSVVQSQFALIAITDNIIDEFNIYRLYSHCIRHQRKTPISSLAIQRSSNVSDLSVTNDTNTNPGSISDLVTSQQAIYNFLQETLTVDLNFDYETFWSAANNIVNKLTSLTGEAFGNITEISAGITPTNSSGILPSQSYAPVSNIDTLATKYLDIVYGPSDGQNFDHFISFKITRLDANFFDITYDISIPITINFYANDKHYRSSSLLTASSTQREQIALSTRLNKYVLLNNGSAIKSEINISRFYFDHKTVELVDNGSTYEINSKYDNNLYNAFLARISYKSNESYIAQKGMITPLVAPTDGYAPIPPRRITWVIPNLAIDNARERLVVRHGSTNFTQDFYAEVAADTSGDDFHDPAQYFLQYYKVRTSKPVIVNGQKVIESGTYKREDYEYRAFGLMNYPLMLKPAFDILGVTSNSHKGWELVDYGLLPYQETQYGYFPAERVSFSLTDTVYGEQGQIIAGQAYVYLDPNIITPDSHTLYAGVENVFYIAANGSPKPVITIQSLPSFAAAEKIDTNLYKITATPNYDEVGSAQFSITAKNLPELNVDSQIINLDVVIDLLVMPDIPSVPTLDSNDPIAWDRAFDANMSGYVDFQAQHEFGPPLTKTKRVIESLLSTGMDGYSTSLRNNTVYYYHTQIQEGQIDTRWMITGPTGTSAAYKPYANAWPLIKETKDYYWYQDASLFQFEQWKLTDYRKASWLAPRYDIADLPSPDGLGDYSFKTTFNLNDGYYYQCVGNDCNKIYGQLEDNFDTGFIYLKFSCDDNIKAIYFNGVNIFDTQEYEIETSYGLPFYSREHGLILKSPSININKSNGLYNITVLPENVTKNVAATSVYQARKFLFEEVKGYSGTRDEIFTYTSAIIISQSAGSYDTNNIYDVAFQESNEIEFVLENVFDPFDTIKNPTGFYCRIIEATIESTPLPYLYDGRVYWYRDAQNLAIPDYQGAAQATFFVGKTNKFIFNVLGTPKPDIFISGGDIPEGISLSSGGVLFGNPSVEQVGTYTIKAIFKNNVGKVEIDFTLFIVDDPNQQPSGSQIEVFNRDCIQLEAFALSSLGSAVKSSAIQLYQLALERSDAAYSESKSLGIKTIGYPSSKSHFFNTPADPENSCAYRVACNDPDSFYPLSQMADGYYISKTLNAPIDSYITVKYRQTVPTPGYRLVETDYSITIRQTVIIGNKEIIREVIDAQSIKGKPTVIVLPPLADAIIELGISNATFKIDIISNTNVFKNWIDDIEIYYGPGYCAYKNCIYALAGTTAVNSMLGITKQPFAKVGNFELNFGSSLLVGALSTATVSLSSLISQKTPIAVSLMGICLSGTTGISIIFETLTEDNQVIETFTDDLGVSFPNNFYKSNNYDNDGLSDIYTTSYFKTSKDSQRVRLSIVTGTEPFYLGFVTICNDDSQTDKCVGNVNNIRLSISANGSPREEINLFNVLCRYDVILNNETRENRKITALPANDGRVATVQLTTCDTTDYCNFWKQQGIGNNASSSIFGPPLNPDGSEKNLDIINSGDLLDLGRTNNWVWPIPLSGNGLLDAYLVTFPRSPGLLAEQNFVQKIEFLIAANKVQTVLSGCGSSEHPSGKEAMPFRIKAEPPVESRFASNYLDFGLIYSKRTQDITRAVYVTYSDSYQNDRIALTSDDYYDFNTASSGGRIQAWLRDFGDSGFILEYDHTSDEFTFKPLLYTVYEDLYVQTIYIENNKQLDRNNIYASYSDISSALELLIGEHGLGVYADDITISNPIAYKSSTVAELNEYGQDIPFENITFSGNFTISDLYGNTSESKFYISREDRVIVNATSGAQNVKLKIFVFTEETGLVSTDVFLNLAVCGKRAEKNISFKTFGDRYNRVLDLNISYTWDDIKQSIYYFKNQISPPVFIGGDDIVSGSLIPDNQGYNTGSTLPDVLDFVDLFSISNISGSFDMSSYSIDYFYDTAAIISSTSSCLDPADALTLTLEYEGSDGRIRSFEETIPLANISSILPVNTGPWAELSSTGNGLRGDYASWISVNFVLDDIYGTGLDQCLPARAIKTNSSTVVSSFPMLATVSYGKSAPPCLPVVNVSEVISGISQNEIQGFSLPDPVGGYYIISFDGSVAEVPYNSDASSLKINLAGMLSIGSTDNLKVTGTGKTNNPFLVEFIGDLSRTELPLMTVDTSNLSCLALGFTSLVVDGSNYERQKISNTTGTRAPLVLTFNGQSSQSIPYNASLNQFKTALKGIKSLGDNVIVTGDLADPDAPYTGPWYVDFTGPFAGQNVPNLIPIVAGYLQEVLWDGKAGTNTIHNLSITATSGTYALTLYDNVNGIEYSATTNPIEYNASKDTLKAAILEAATFLLDSDVTVTDAVSSSADTYSYNIEYIGNLAKQPVKLMKCDATRLSLSPPVVVERVQVGLGVSERQRLSMRNITSGYYYLTVEVNGITETTSALAFDASDIAIEQALLNLDVFTSGDVYVRYDTLQDLEQRAFTFSFNDSFGNIANLTVDSTALVCDPFALASATSPPYRYALERCDAAKVLGSEQGGTILCRPGTDDDVVLPKVDCCAPDTNNIEFIGFERELFNPYTRINGEIATIKRLASTRRIDINEYNVYFRNASNILEAVDPNQVIESGYSYIFVQKIVDTVSGRNTIQNHLRSRAEILPKRMNWNLL